MNESYFELIFAIFDEKPLFLSILDTFWAIFGQISYSTSGNDCLSIELNYLLNWISRIFLELNNILNWILGKAILNRILNESFFGKIQKLNWIRLGIGHHYAWISKWWYVWWSPADIYLQETSKIAGKLPGCPSRPPCPLRQGLKERRMISEASRYKLAHRLNIIHTKGHV